MLAVQDWVGLTVFLFEKIVSIDHPFYNRSSISQIALLLLVNMLNRSTIKQGDVVKTNVSCLATSTF